METYDEIYERMKNKYEQESGAQFDEASDIAIRLRVLAGEIYNAQVNMKWIKNQMYVETATGESLDYLAKQRGLERKPAQKAQGEITFFISEPIDHTIIIPKGSVAATAEEIPRRFVTTEDEEISQGNNFVSVYAEAEKAGSSGNVALGKVTVAVDVPSEIEWVTNSEVYSGGTDEESDEQLRERIRDSYLRLPNGTNAAYYEQLALTVDGIVKAKAVGKVRGNGTVDVYVSGDGKGALSTAINQAQTLIESKRELNVNVQVKNASLTAFDLDVTVYKREEFSDSEIIKKCKDAFNDFIRSLGIGQKLYLSALGKALLDTGCIVNYEFNVEMSDTAISASQCFMTGTASVLVK